MISAKIIADSISPTGKRITTFELVYHRFIHGELMTHRMFSRNAASSRAIPIQGMMDMVEQDCAIPVYWGLDQPGMQASGEHPHPATCEYIWKTAAQSAIKSAGMLKAAGLHKQIANRVLEPFQWMKTIVTATEFDNFWSLRCHPHAQPEIHVLAEDEMYRLFKESKPRKLALGEWHTPYFGKGYWAPYETLTDKDTNAVVMCDEERYSMDQALKISASCCAQVSYRKLDDSLDKAMKVYDRLVETSPVHASPFEHMATPMELPCINPLYGMDLDCYDIDEGVTHMDMAGKFWSGNFKGWIQYRHLLDNNTCYEYNG